MSKKTKWKVENESEVLFQLDDNHKLHIERTESGFCLRVFDERGHNHRPEEPIMLYYSKISDAQLGYLGEIKK